MNFCAFCYFIIFHFMQKSSQFVSRNIEFTTHFISSRLPTLQGQSVVLNRIILFIDRMSFPHHLSRQIQTMFTLGLLSFQWAVGREKTVLENILHNHATMNLSFYFSTGVLNLGKPFDSMLVVSYTVYQIQVVYIKQYFGPKTLII